MNKLKHLGNGVVHIFVFFIETRFNSIRSLFAIAATDAVCLRHVSSLSELGDLNHECVIRAYMTTLTAPHASSSINKILFLNIVYQTSSFDERNKKNGRISNAYGVIN